ncbi:MAG: hypothetical protein ABFD46_04575 [Armatimonadota bacterium]
MFQFLNFDTLPLWATILKRILVILILTALGLHAYVQYKRQTRMTVPERWAFLAFSVMMLFGVIVNTASIAFAAKLNLRKGPYNFGSFSLFLFIIYLIFVGGITHRRRTY